MPRRTRGSRKRGEPQPALPVPEGEGPGHTGQVVGADGQLQPRHCNPPATEYYGSMAAGAIVGAARPAAKAAFCSSCGAARNGGSTHAQAMPGRTQQSGSRRQNKSSKQQQPPLPCRAQLLPYLETRARVPESLLAGGADAAALPAEEQALLTVWLVLTPNALSMFDGPSRTRRLAVLPLRQLSTVEPLLDEALGVRLRYHAVLPACVRPPPFCAAQLPLLNAATLLFATQELQHRWCSAFTAGLAAVPPRPWPDAPMAPRLAAAAVTAAAGAAAAHAGAAAGAATGAAAITALYGSAAVALRPPPPLDARAPPPLLDALPDLSVGIGGSTLGQFELRPVTSVLLPPSPMPPLLPPLDGIDAVDDGDYVPELVAAVLRVIEDEDVTIS